MAFIDKSYQEQAAELPDLCPSCGAGVVGRSPDGKPSGVFALPRGFPFDRPCEECSRRDAIRMRAAGERRAMEREWAIFEAIGIL